MIPAFPVYLFDLDGTLLDGAADICGAIWQVLEGHVDSPPEYEYLKGFVGSHLDAVFVDVRPHYSRGQIDGLIEAYRSVYPLRGHAATSVYPGVAEALQTLPGRKATATTKGTPTSREVLTQFGLVCYFDHVQGTDGFPAKPSPEV